MTKLKPFANDKLKIAEMVISLFDRIENTVGIGENISFLELINYVYTTYVFFVVKSLYVYFGPVAFIYKL